MHIPMVLSPSRSRFSSILWHNCHCIVQKFSESPTKQVCVDGANWTLMMMGPARSHTLLSSSCGKINSAQHM